ncbi:MAG TPA: hypothetical protein VGG34_04350 [Opitutaceae bacterium]
MKPPRLSLACGWALVSLMGAATRLLCADAPGTDFLKSGPTKPGVTTLPAFTVDEKKSDKTHTLFMGADIAVNLDRDTFKVKDVDGSDWVIEINGRDRRVSARTAPLNVKVTPSLKLTEASATIIGFTRVAGFSFANDPSTRLTKAIDESAMMNADLQYQADVQRNIVETEESRNSGAALAGSWNQFGDAAMETTAKYAFANSQPATHPNGNPIPQPSTAAPTASSNTVGTVNGVSDATAQLNIGLAQVAANGAQAQTLNGYEVNSGALATKGPDALNIAFDIRSPKPLNEPYVVTMTKFKTPTTKPGMVQNLIYAKSLHPIDEHLLHVHFEEDGFPPLYEIVDFQVHIYNRGEEVATNLARDRVELTRDEAFEYVKMEYLGAHPRDTLPPTAAMAKFPSDLAQRLAEGMYRKDFYVKVGADGLAHQAFSDRPCLKPIGDAYLDSVVERIRFKPALRAGTPAEGVALINLNRLVN